MWVDKWVNFTCDRLSLNLPDKTYIMNREQLTSYFVTNHNKFVDYIQLLDDRQFLHAANGKWSAGQQLSHIQLCLKPIAQVLASKDYIRQTFGPVDRPYMDHEAVVKAYTAALQNGGKSPDRFVPPAISTEEKDNIAQDVNALVQTIQQQLNTFSEDEMDNLALPHPLLGKMTVREFFYLMADHATHHLGQVQKNLTSLN